LIFIAETQEPPFVGRALARRVAAFDAVGLKADLLSRNNNHRKGAEDAKKA
jgi:hypothetical protein